jgi:hypothetical protein
MDLETLKIDIGWCDISALSTDKDFEGQAKKLLPAVLENIGEALGKAAWEKTQASFKGIPGMKLNTSSSDKAKFIREAGENYRRGLGAPDQRKIEELIVEKLRERKKAGASNLS